MNEINELISQRDALLMEIGQLNGLIAGSFFVREMNGKPRFCLSIMQGRKQRLAPELELASRWLLLPPHTVLLPTHLSTWRRYVRPE